MVVDRHAGAQECLANAGCFRRDFTGVVKVRLNPHFFGRSEQVGAFRRVHVLRYGESDISANYDLRRGSDFLRLSVYIYPAPHVPAAQRATACRDVMTDVDASTANAHKGAELRDTGEAPAVPETDPALRHRSVFSMTIPFFTSETPGMACTCCWISFRT